MIDNKTYTLFLTSDDNNRATIANLWDDEFQQEVSNGVAVRRVTDEPHSCVGEMLAAGRALVSHGEQLIEAAQILEESGTHLS